MLKVRQRGPRRKHRLEGFIAGRRVRLSLGTRNYEAAVRLAGKVERAVVEGNESKLWPEIQNLLPSSSFRRLAEIIGYTPATQAEDPTWESLRQSFEVHCRHRIARNAGRIFIRSSDRNGSFHGRNQYNDSDSFKCSTMRIV